jgi:RNA polymerase sigma-70 factor (ECF subfamily)
MHDEDSVDLLARYRQGDDQAAELLFRRYVGRLTALAQSRLSSRLARRIDPDDVVQSAYRSFFRHARDGAYELEESGDLWKLLVVMTLNKLRGQVEHHQAGKRAMNAEQSIAAGDTSAVNVHAEALASDPSPEEALAVVEEVAELMRDLTPVHCRMLELRLQGYRIEEIAEQVNRSERGVRRLLDKIKERLHQRLAEESAR